MQTASFDPLLVLGCSSEDAATLMRGRVVTPGETEGVALRTYRWRRHLHDPTSYWMTVGQAAVLLHRPKADVDRLIHEWRLPCSVHADGTRLLRRAEVVDLAARL